ncbi:MAG: hypothetical protein RQ731_08475 [Anaerosomatales bacterium]|nr:hypothetical protein [Anaerosomatales bacterium]
MGSKPSAAATAEETSECLGAVVERSIEAGMVEKLLDLAREDCEWRQHVEHALQQKKTGLGKLLKGGAKPKDIWHDSLLRRTILKKLATDPVTFDLFALTHPVVGEIESDDERDAEALIADLGPYVAVLAAWLLHGEDDELKATVLAVACDELAMEQAAEAVEEDALLDEAADAVVLETEIDDLRSRACDLESALAEARRVTESQAKEIKQLRKGLRLRTSEVSRKDRKAGANAEELATLRAQNTELESQLAEVRADRDERARQARKLAARAASDSNGIRTVEDKRLQETRALRDAIDRMSDRLEAATELSAALSAQVVSLEADLAAEREQRHELEVAFSAFGMEDLLSDSHSFGQAVDALVRFRDSVAEYAARQRERETQRQAAELEARAERERAIAARRAQEEADEAWLQKEQDRLLELEAQLFGTVPPDHVIIDGHNLVHRVYRPEEEASTRPWLEKTVLKMAERVEGEDWDIRFHLVFDTPHRSNTRGAGHGVDVHFHNNVAEGGADARIAELLEEGNPAARYMVVSTDRKHVWSDALERMNAEGSEIDLVQVELLASYLQMLGHLDR